MSISRHHAEWLSLLEISGPFLSMPVLCDALPQGLDNIDTDLVQMLRTAYEEWLDSQHGVRADSEMHRAWVTWVLRDLLDMDKALKDASEFPALAVTVAEQGETLRPDYVIVGRPASGDRSGPVPRMLVCVYPASQDLTKQVAGSRWKALPDTRMMTLLHAVNVPLGLVTNGEQWMLVHAPKGQTTGFISWYADLWLEERLTLRAFTTLLSANRFFSVPADKTIEKLLADSANDQSEVTDQLGYQVRHAVEVLVQALDVADQDRGGKLLEGISEEKLYEAAVTVMMRLVFLLSAEERNLILSGDEVYSQNYAVSTLRAQLREVADHSGEEFLDRRYDAWSRLLATFRAIYGGIHHDRMVLPAYGGGLFDPDRYPFLEGRRAIVGKADAASWRKVPAPTSAELTPLPINNRTVLHLLEAVQLLQMKVPGGGPAEARRISFRALDIEQIGHVYENLLDHTAKRAKEPVLGLSGSTDARREVPLSVLEERAKKGQDALIDFVRESTGRTPNAIRKALDLRPDMLRGQQLAVACGNNAELVQRATPFLGLIRDDDYGHPLIILPGSIYVAAGQDRRSSGTHYTSRVLTEPIVEHTLEPLIYIGPREGKPRAEWILRSPAEILKLLICDMAMGSGAFLVQTVRYLSERLIEAWERAEMALALTHGHAVLATVEGEPTDDPNKALPADPNERQALARRLLVDRCIYGVDKNPLAVEMAKLSLWLITMDKGRPFTFLDHALKCGDSLVGADEKEFLAWSQTLRGTIGPLYYEQNEHSLATAREKRRELHAFLVNDVRDAEQKSRLLAEAEAAVERVKRGCDLLIGARLIEGLSAGDRETLLAELLIEHTAKVEMTSVRAQKVLAAARAVRSFHWFLEFPEAFVRGGFDAFVGNPPFLGGRRISGDLGIEYADYLRRAYPIVHGQADLCVFFFLRAFHRLRRDGTYGLLATNTIAQGDSRESSLDHLLTQGATVFAANSSVLWPGAAAVYVSMVCLCRGPYSGAKILDGRRVEHISAMLDRAEAGTAPPMPLRANESRCFKGSDVGGIGFVIEPEEAAQLIAKNPKNRDVLLPYLTGQDLNTRPDQSASRWVVKFYDWSLEQASEYPDCLRLVEERVKPGRNQANRDWKDKQWWLFARTRSALYSAIRGLRQVLVVCQVSRTLAFSFVPNGLEYSQRLIVFAFDQYHDFAVLQSVLHDVWARKHSSTLKEDLSYTIDTAFNTFPFPDRGISLDTLGEQYYSCRRAAMLSRAEGLTAIYNRFHDPAEAASDILALRNLQVGIDAAVAAAYGWDDLDLARNFCDTTQGIRFTNSEAARQQILARLLSLNHERYAEEVAAGLHEKSISKAATRTGTRKTERKKAKDDGGTLTLW